MLNKLKIHEQHIKTIKSCLDILLICATLFKIIKE